ncbi:MAG TPA: hypothetical protein PKJ51_03050 [Methanothrix sp.]|nr:hypothetical protein [Methanothrix sp.]
MTCIVAIAEEGTVFMGGDRLLTYGNTGLRLRDGSPKVAILKAAGEAEYLVGVAGDGRVGDVVLRATFGPVNPDPETTIREEFIPAVRAALSVNGALMRFEDGQDRGASTLVGHRGRLFIVSDNFGVEVVTDGCAAIGSARQIALGSLASTAGDPEQRILMALKAAEKYHVDVMGPFDILKLGPARR